MGGWIDRLVDGSMDGWMDGWTDGLMDRICRSQCPRGLRRGSELLACWDCGFESAGGMDVCLLWLLCVVR
jgi:hypothetical protein